jgi:hypothetical protein
MSDQFRFLKTLGTPIDPYDRLWQRYGDVPAWTNITTSATVDVSNISSFDKPSVILQSAATPLNGTRIDVACSSASDATLNQDNSTYLLLLYFAELQRLPSNALRQFDILVDSATWNGSQQYTVSLVATRGATLPPILNAFEIYTVQPANEIATNDADGIC